MRRLLPIAAFALALAVPLWAQHGGGHAGGHVGGFGGHGFGGHVGGAGHFSGGMHSAPRSFSHAPSFSQRGFSHRTFANNGFRNNGFRHHRSHNFGFRNNCFGFRCRGFAYPWWYAGYYDPYWWYDSSSSYDEDYERDRALANEMNQQSLEEQRLRQEEERDGDQDLYARPAPAASPASSTAEAQPSTVLVFRDQHQKEVRNYAIVGRTLWNFGSQRTERIPLTDLDLTATAKANDDRGLTFSVPSSAQGQ